MKEVGIAPRPYQSPHPQFCAGFSVSLRTAKFWAKYKGKPIVMSFDIDFLNLLWESYRQEAETLHDDTPKPGEEAAWGGLMICAKTDNEAMELANDMKWMWEKWVILFGLPFPELLFGTPEKLNKRIKEVTKTIPTNEIFLMIPQGIHDRDQILPSLELFSKNAIKNFN